MTLKDALKASLRKAAVPIIYRYPPVGLQPERLALYLHGLLMRADLDGDVAEVGCNVGGTAALAYNMLNRLGWKGQYICYDTFSGFVPDQFEADVALGTQNFRRNWFGGNSIDLVRKVLAYHGASRVRLVQGDIVKVSDDQLSRNYCAVLLDVDLSVPTYEALKRFWPRLMPGGMIFVDDCPEDYDWKAREGYARFCTEMGLKQEYKNGLGILEKIR